MRRDPTDYSPSDVAMVYPEMCGEHLLRAIRQQAFPPPDYVGPDAVPYWHEPTILAYTNGRATVEAASGEYKGLAAFVRDHVLPPEKDDTTL